MSIPQAPNRRVSYNAMLLFDTRSQVISTTAMVSCPTTPASQKFDYEGMIDATSASRLTTTTKSLYYANHTPPTEDATTSLAPSDA